MKPSLNFCKSVRLSFAPALPFICELAFQLAGILFRSKRNHQNEGKIFEF